MKKAHNEISLKLYILLSTFLLFMWPSLSQFLLSDVYEKTYLLPL